jgi:hypothetical protein
MKMDTKSNTALIVLATVLALFVGCGGGGGGGGTSAEEPALPAIHVDDPAPVNSGDDYSVSADGEPEPGDSGDGSNVPPDDDPVNLSPVADAGKAQTVAVNSLVTLHGGKSYDPDDDYPLLFSWKITCKPAASTAELLDADKQSTAFVADCEGDFEIELTVTDQKGAVSEPAVVIVSTVNSAPIADAGPNQSFTEEGTIVDLDGSQSYDPDGDPITYAWVMTVMPEGSNALLDDPTAEDPRFTADLLGTYMVALVVTDSHGVASASDTVMITSENVRPVAHAGVNQVVPVGASVSLDGSGSYDANEDELTYRWSISAGPEDSTAVLTGADRMYASFVPDMQGIYTAILVVSDGLEESNPDAVDILAVDFETLDDFISVLMDAVNVINSLEDDVFRNSNLRDELTRKIIWDVLNSYLMGTYDHQDLKDSLKNDIGNKTDGCYESGSAKNDWILDCDAQDEIYPLLLQAIDYLEALYSTSH